MLIAEEWVTTPKQSNITDLKIIVAYFWAQKWRLGSRGITEIKSQYIIIGASPVTKTKFKMQDL